MRGRGGERTGNKRKKLFTPLRGVSTSCWVADFIKITFPRSPKKRLNSTGHPNQDVNPYLFSECMALSFVSLPTQFSENLGNPRLSQVEAMMAIPWCLQCDSCMMSSGQCISN